MKRSLISGFEKLKEKVHAIRGSVFAGFCARNKTAAIALAVAAVFLTAAAYRSSLAPGDAYILSDGRLSAVDLSSGEAVQVTVRGTKDGTVRTKEVILRHKDGDEKAVEDVVSDDEEIDFEISRVVRSINNSGARIAYLPETAEDGTALDWSAKKSSPKYLFPIPAAAAALYYMYRGEASKEKEREKKNAEAIVRELPSFASKLVMFLSSGLIYEDAMDRIIDGFEASGRKDCFAALLSEFRTESALTGESQAEIMLRYSRRHKIRELSRISALIAENRDMGADLRVKLRAEGSMLWSERRKIAEERGKTAEVKLAIPMSMLLIVLILITAAPALMQV